MLARELSKKPRSYSLLTLAVRPRTNGGKALRLAFWTVDGVRGRKLEMEHFLSEHSIDICLLNEMLLKSDRALSFANYVCRRTNNPTRGGGTAILVRGGIDHYAVPVSGLQLLEPTTMHLLLATTPVKLVAAYLSPIRPLIEPNLTECQRGGFSVLLAADLNAKRTDWNSWLIASE
jgi:hypothetical protein